MIIFPAQIGLTIISLLQWCFQSYIQDSGITLQLLPSYTSVWIGGNKCTCRSMRMSENRGQTMTISCLTHRGWVKHHLLGPDWWGKHLASFQQGKRCSFSSVSSGMWGSASPCPSIQLVPGTLAAWLRRSEIAQSRKLCFQRGGWMWMRSRAALDGEGGEGGWKHAQWMGLRMVLFILFQEETRLNPLL